MSAIDCVADESIVAALSLLPSADSVASFSGTCKRFLEISRVDRIWLPLADTRWRFGSAAASQALLPPGAREAAEECAFAATAKAPLGRQADAFAFFGKRSKVDMQVRALLLQMVAAGSHPAEGSREPLAPGATTKVTGLQQQPQLNGRFAVVAGPPEADSGRLPVTMLCSLRVLSVKPENLILESPAPGGQDVSSQVMSMGDDAVDALRRLACCKAVPKLPEAARKLLGYHLEQWAVRQWQHLLEDRGRADLVEEGGFVISQWGEPEVADVRVARDRLAELAEEVTRRVSSTAPLRERVEAVGAVLWDTWGFSGNSDDYYDPRNSLLHSVLERKKGIPISLSILWVAVARRVDVPCYLCANMPMHIVIRVTAGGQATEDIFVDAFNRQVMDYEGLNSFVRQLGLPFHEEFIDQRPATAVYARMLRNLLSIYRQRAASPVDASMRLGNLQLLLGACSQAIAVAEPDAAAEAEELRRFRDGIQSAIESLGP